MSYTRTNWTDRSVEYDNRYTMTDNQDGTVTLAPATGEVYTEGTLLSAENLNNIEDGIEEALQHQDQDTDWVNMQYKSGYTPGTAGQLRYRVRNGVVYIIGGAEGQYDSSVYTTVTAVPLPEEIRPIQNIRCGAVGRGARSCIMEVNMSGHIIFGYNGTSRPNWIGGQISYPL